MNVACDTQGTSEWMAVRCGAVTASRMVDVLAKLKSGQEAATRRAYRIELVCERLTGDTGDHYCSPAMQRGTEMEPFARAAYEIARDVTVETTGFILHPTIKWWGASPDGLVGDDGLVEFKCPATSTHLGYILDDVVPTEYQPQMLTQMDCTGREWCDFVSYDDRVPPHLQLFIKRFPRDEKRIAEMRTEVTKFLAEVDALLLALPKAEAR